MTFVDFTKRMSPPVLQDDAGEALAGTFALLADCTAEALRSALRAPMIAEDGDGPAYDALSRIGREMELPQYPGETWSAYRDRLRSIWNDAPLWGADMVSQFAAAGFAGVEVKTNVEWPDMGAADYWSQFWIWFPFGTHPVVSTETQTVTTETGGFVVHDAEGITLAQYRTINSVIARFKPGHWICRGVRFEWQPALIPDLLYWSGAGDPPAELTLDGTDVDAWSVFTQSGAARPTWSDPGVTGDGTQTLETTDAALLTAFGATGVTIAVHAQRAGTGSAQALVGFRDAGGSVLSVGWDASDRLYVTRDGATVTDPTPDDGDPHVYLVTVDGSLATLRADNAVVAVGSVGASALTLTQSELFADGAGANVADATIFGWALIADVVSPEHRQQITDWFLTPDDFDTYPGWDF